MIGLVRRYAFGKLRAVKWLVPVRTALLLFFVSAVALSAADGKLSPLMNSAADAGFLTLTGKVVKLSGATNAVGFRTGNGDVYPLVRNPKSEALFVETNLVEKLLIVKGRLRSQTRNLEITANLHSWANGKQHEIYYYCDICAIKTSDPGTCMCCREPMKFVEEE